MVEPLLPDSDAQLRRMLQEQQALFEAAEVGIVFVKNGVVARSNPAFDRIMGHERHGLDGRATREWFMSDEDHQVLEGHAGEQGLGGHTVYRELPLLRKDGQMFFARLSKRVVDPRDLTAGSVCLVEDISERLTLQAQLQVALEAAEAAAQAKSAFLSNMSHEIRTPMNAIMGLSHLTLRTRLTPQQADYLKKIELSAQHLMDIINDVLDFSKIEAGRMALETSAFDIDEMLSGVADMVSLKATEKGLAFVHFLDPAIPRRVVGDAPRLSQALSNLAHNAVKFTDSGEVVVSAYCKALHGAHVDVSFTVRDTGIGMTEAQVAQLFRSFSQADTSTTRRYGGTGLGLALSKQLVSMMGCPTIEVLSKPGRGSTFSFTLRLPVAEAEAEAGFVAETPRAPGLRRL